MLRIRRWLVAGLLCAAPLPAAAQEVASPPRDTTQVLRLFLDCATQGCDFDYLRTQVLEPLATNPPSNRRLRLWSAGC